MEVLLHLVEGPKEGLSEFLIEIALVQRMHEELFVLLTQGLYEPEKLGPETVQDFEHLQVLEEFDVLIEVGVVVDLVQDFAEKLMQNLRSQNQTLLLHLLRKHFEEFGEEAEMGLGKELFQLGKQLIPELEDDHFLQLHSGFVEKVVQELVGNVVFGQELGVLEKLVVEFLEEVDVELELGATNGVTENQVVGVEEGLGFLDHVLVEEKDLQKSPDGSDGLL